MAHYLTGQFLIAMPQMDDPRFRNTVIFMCNHDDDSAMGVVINQAMDGLYLDSLAEQVGLARRGSGETHLSIMAGRLNSHAGWSSILLIMSCLTVSTSMITWR